jgi:hypothetical protein
MEYLMTYGWAILIIALTLAVLYSLGIMNPKNFLPRAPPGSCFVFRPNGPGTTDYVSLQGTCGYLPMYVASFNGVNAYIQTPSIAPSSITITGWIKFNSNKNWMIYGHGVAGNAGTYYLYGDETGGTSAKDIDMTVFASNGTRYDAMITNYNFNLGQWYFVAGSFDASSRNLSAFVNGVKVASTPYAALGTQTIRGLIGAYEGGYFVNGSIANVQIYNTALTPQEIQYLYQQGLGGGPIRLGSLVGWWPLNGDAKDYSGNNNHGTIYGGVTFVQNYNPP